MKPIKIPIEDFIDLHTFRPEDVSDLLSEYFSECRNNKIFTVRVIHGKGRGFLKKGVMEILKKSPLVESFKDAPMEAGSWGATIVELKK
ncbi:MAG: Smr/MutS family protein [Desulfobacterales bacterium]|nr:Smr/MutS family protein [Desulfobacterales bacterium]